MRIAVLSDVHANLEALSAVWADLRAAGVEEIFCLGDMIGYGPDPEEVLCFVREHGARCCMGNHELGVAFPRERRWFNSTSRKGVLATHALLSADSLAYIAALPRFFCAHGARFVHGFPPDSATTYLFAQTDDQVKQWWRDGEWLTFVGHTHELVLAGVEDGQVTRRNLGRESFVLGAVPVILNVGSVGQPRDGDNRAKYVLWEPQTGAVEVRFVRYDIERTVEKIRQRGLPEYYATRLW